MRATSQLFLACLLGLPLWPGLAAAQALPNEGIYGNLSPGKQKIVQSLYLAHLRGWTSGVTFRPLSRDQIAAMKREGHGWGEVFEQLRSKGMIREQSLGQVVRKYSSQPPAQTVKAESSAQAASAQGRAKSVVSAKKRIELTASLGSDWRSVR